MPGFLPCIVLSMITLLGFLALSKSNERLEFFPWVQYGILVVMTWIGFFSFCTALLDIDISYSMLSVWMAIGLAMMIAAHVKVHRGESLLKIQKYQIRQESVWSFSATTFFVIVAGILFFTPDLLPSSMTGDPPRHFMRIIALSDELYSMVYKPILYINSSIVMLFFDEWIDRDKIFVLMNFFILWISAVTAVSAMINMLPKITKGGIFTGALLISFGYPFLALQYGYLTLLLSSAYAFSIISLVVDNQSKLSHVFRQSIITLLAVGLVLTHSYLVPEIFFGIIFATLLLGYVNKSPMNKVVIDALPHWLVIALVAYASNATYDSSVAETVGRYGRVILAEGFVNEDFLANILYFVIPASAVLITERKDKKIVALGAFLTSAVIFTALMYTLMLSGKCSPYYVNRNLVVLMPILIILSIFCIQKYTKDQLLVRGGILGFYCILVITPYFIYQNSPLALSNNTIMLLKEASGSVYMENARNVSFAPLQMTEADRAKMKMIKNNTGSYLESGIEQLPVIGTDHEVIWFQYYTGINASYTQRKDGFVDSALYVDDYNRWRNDADNKYIAIIKHSVDNISPQIISDIEQRSDKVLEGDSFVIFRKKTEM